MLATQGARQILGKLPTTRVWALSVTSYPGVDHGLGRDHGPQGVVVRRSLERVAAREHLMHEEAQAPPVHHAAVAPLQEHLGSHVLLRAAVRPEAKEKEG